MLVRKHLGGGHQRPLVPALDRPEQCGERHDGLARADVSLEKAVHRKRTSEVREDLAHDPTLRTSGGEGQRADEGRDHRVGSRARSDLERVDDVAEPPGVRLERSAPELERELEAQQLIEGEPSPGGHGLLEGLRGVDPSHGGRSVEQVELVEHPRVEWLGEGACPPQRLGHHASEVPARHTALLRLRVDRDDPEGLGGALGLTRHAHQDVDHRIGHLRTSGEGLELAEEQGLGADEELPLPPGLIEERDLHRAGRVVDRDGDDGATLAGAAGAHLGDAAEHHGLVTDHEVSEVRLAGPIDVATWVGPEQVEDRVHAELRQCGCALGADALQDTDLDASELGQGAPRRVRWGREILGAAHSIPKR